MAEFTIPPEIEPLVEACGEAALWAFQAADFANDPSAAFSEGMSAAMDVMADAGMPPHDGNDARLLFKVHLNNIWQAAAILWMHLMLSEVLSTV